MPLEATKMGPEAHPAEDDTLTPQWDPTHFHSGTKARPAGLQVPGAKGWGATSDPDEQSVAR